MLGQMMGLGEGQQPQRRPAFEPRCDADEGNTTTADQYKIRLYQF
jgi:hypothetical protein